MRVNLSPRFERAYERLPTPIQNDFDKKINWFIANSRDPRLKTHKLKGKLYECLSFYLRDGFRVLFEQVDPNTVNLLDVGSHDKYRLWDR